MPIALLLTTAATTVVGVTVLHTLRGLRLQVAELRAELTESRSAGPRAVIPAARTASGTDEIRAAVAEALAEERERELAEARAFWAAQEARDGSDESFSLPGVPECEAYLPRQSDFAGLDHLKPVAEPASEGDEHPGDSPELAAARRRHPSHPDFIPVPSPVVNDHERTVACLEDLAASRTELADVRPGPLGTLDVYVFADGTTLCMTPGHRETAEHLAMALRSGQTPVLLGGSVLSGGYTLTFRCGEENLYIVADRVIASL